MSTPLPPSTDPPPVRPSSPDRPEFSFFADGEQPMQAAFRSLRDRALAPVVSLCRRCRITADVVSALAMAMLVPVAVGLFQSEHGWGAWLVVAGLILHVSLDGLDGPVARDQGTAGPAGAFTDMCLDHTGFLIVAALLTAAGDLDGAVACAYVGSYTLSVVMTITLNLLGRPMRYVVRTKYVYYALVALNELARVNMLTEAGVAFSIVHVLFAAVGFIAVRRALR